MYVYNYYIYIYIYIYIYVNICMYIFVKIEINLYFKNCYFVNFINRDIEKEAYEIDTYIKIEN